MLTETQLAEYREKGYVVCPQVFPGDEVSFYIDHFMRLRAQGEHPGDYQGVDVNSSDPLKRFPRMIHMHHWDEASLRWMLDRRLNEILTGLLGREPLAVQTMLYFKPPGARGQALHQDNYYLRVRPGTCMAAWMALDACDEENGCMQAVAGSHNWPILCPQKADTKLSFTDVTVALPEGAAPEPIIMNPGDVFFFNGAVVHGSYPNRSRARFRRALIGHYVEGNSEMLSAFYSRVYRMDGSLVDIENTPEGGMCGEWVEEDGQPVVAMRESEGSGPAHE
jgi:phytanoyl-CoA hydroxylase